MSRRRLSVLVLAVLSACSGDNVASHSDAGRVSPATLRAPAEAGTVTCTSPDNFTSVPLTPGGAAVELGFQTTLESSVVAGTYEVRAYDNGVVVATTASIDPIPLKLSYGDHRLTIALASPGGEPVTGAFCTTTIRVTQPCVLDLDCTDDFYCSSNTCVTAPDGTSECAFGAPPVAGCCVADFDCALGFCRPDTHTCAACADDSHCDDGNACTTDSCGSGSCSHFQADPLCCDCATPGGDSCETGAVCATASCNCASSQCIEVPIVLPDDAVCCETGKHASCDDEDPCTVDLCVQNVCRNTESIGGASACCAADLECDDGNACTAEGCDVNTHLCVTTVAPLNGPGCCFADGECADDDPSTLDACVVFQCMNTPDAAYCTIPSSSDVVIHELMIDPSASSDALGEWIELTNRTDAPIDLSGWSLTELGDTPQSVELSPTAPLVLPALGFLVLCRNGDVATNGGIDCDFVYGNAYTLANGPDDVILKDAAGATVDTVSYDGGPNFPNPDGASIALVNAGSDNDVGASWKASTFAGSPGADAATPGGGNVDVFQILIAAACHEKPVDNLCTVDTCAGDGCDHIAVEGCCNIDTDCTVDGPCLEATCVQSKCVTESIPPSECCRSNADCSDGAACSLDMCVGNVCRHASALALSTGCCDTDADCGGPGNACVKAGCDPDLHVCLPPTAVQSAGCCTIDTYPDPADASECDDGDSSTIDTCKDYLCLTFPNPTYCDAQPGQGGINHCALDGNPCTGQACDVANKTCQYDTIATCCQAAFDCFDGDPCTTDSCELKSGNCTFKPIFGCCTTSAEQADCDDGSLCTTDRCIDLQPLEGSSGDFFGRCRSVYDVAECCATPLDCDDGNACTVDLCADAGCTHSAVALPAGQVCCDAAAGSIAAQCGDTDSCTSDICVENRCKHAAVPKVGGANCCHAQGDAAVECNDNNPCTLDSCVFGWCKHILAAEADCCQVDLDCNDLNACTTDACALVSGKKICAYANFQCDDGDFCNGIEACDASVGCATAAPVVLDDGVPCTVDACDEASKAVTHTPSAALCDDSKFCNGKETCDLVIGCQPGASPIGDDGVTCTQDVCNEPADAFDHVAVDALCDDGKSCTGTETCNATLGCQKGNGGAVLTDGIACTIDICDDVTGDVKHIPEDDLCDDSLVCTTDSCGASGCSHPIAPNFCLIEGVCRAAGVKSPTSACLLCEPATSTSAWTPVAGSTETCNGVDDDCDNVTDEAANGQALTQACANACGQIGVETCTKGGYSGCTAPKLLEVCGDGFDNDCDGVTDGATCAAAQLPVLGADVRFQSTRGHASNIVVDNGDGTYSTGVYDLANPNESGTATANAYGKLSAPLAYDVAAAAPLQIEVVAMRDRLYVDNRDERFAVQVRDLLGRPAATGTPVSIVVTGASLGSAVTLGATVDTAGRTQLNWTAPVSAFTAGGPVSAVASVYGIKAAPVAVDLVPAPAELVLGGVGGGITLPRSPRFPNEQFDVPVILNTGVLNVAIYDVRISFNRFMLQVVSVTGGSCAAYGNAPTSNAAGNANTTGTVNINAQSADFTAACTKGSAVHVATITFKVLNGLTPDDPTVSATVTGHLQDMLDPNIVTIASDDPMQVADATGVDDIGQVRAWSAASMGILARVPDVELLAWKSVTGLNDNAQIEVTSYRRDFTTADVSASNLTAYGNDSPAILQLSSTGSIAPSTQPGLATVAITHKGFVSTVAITVLQPSSVGLELSDITLEPVQNAVTGGGVQVIQTATIKAKVTWSDASGPIFEHDVTDRFASAGQVVTPSSVAYDLTEKRLTSSVAGSHVISLRTSQGLTVATANLGVAPTATAVTCAGLDVVAPCAVAMVDLDPSPAVLLGQTTATARVSATMTSYGQKCQVQVYARTSDGSRMKITGTNGVSVASQSSSIASSTVGGQLTALTAGTAIIDATWQLASGVICTGSAPVKVDLPTPIQILATPSLVTLAISSVDPAATIKKLPTGQQLAVTVVYSDGTTQDFTASATYDAVSGDPANLILVSSGGYITTTTAGAGTVSLPVSVPLYPGLAAAIVTVDVVKASGLAATAFETYTPTLPRVSDKTYSFIEGTPTRQDALFEVLLTFNDGSTADVTTDGGLSITPLNPANNQPLPGIVLFDKPTRRITASAPGAVDVLFGLGPLATKLVGVTVDSAKEGVVVLTPDAPPDTFSGIKDIGTMTVKVWCVMNDGTRRRLSDSRFVPNLLSFSSSNGGGATIAASGVATIRGNAQTAYSVDIAPGVDNGAQFTAITLDMPCNLLPACGDFDFGDTVGLAYKDRKAGDVFNLEVRVNTCDEALGAFDIELTHDKAVLTVESVAAAGAAVGNVFSANWLGQPGSTLMNAIMNPEGAQFKGAAVPVATVTFKALKGGDHLSEMGGIVEKVLNITGQDLGPPPNRPFVAVIGILDPPCLREHVLDINGDCAVDGTDAALIGASLASGQRTFNARHLLEVFAAMDVSTPQ